jgi:DNA helicase-2/ATP-dependent DNA helicase PcrA
MPGTPSRFLDAVPPGIVEDRRTGGLFGSEWVRERPRRPKYAQAAAEHEPEMESQDSPRYVKGERVHHRKFGPGTVRAVGGQGRELKVAVQFDDEEIGEKQLLVAYAGLQRALEGA